jgi:NO-binding membrane sensor protein with MHYT domain
MAINVGDVLQARYDTVAVAMSYLVSVLGSYAALAHTQYLHDSDGKLRWSMVVGAAVALGGVGIWTMHFIGMMGYRLPTPVRYEGALTLVSLVAAAVISGIALVLPGRSGRFSPGGWAAGSVVAGLGVCVMHYMGMYAMSLRAQMLLDPMVVGISVAIAITAAAAALWLAYHVKRTSHRIVAAVVMGVAVCAMHYTGMSAADYVCVAQEPAPEWAVGGANLPLVVFTVAGLVLVMLTWNVLGVLDQAGANKPVAARIPRRIA